MMQSPGKLGVWTWVDGFSAPQAAGFAQQLENWGYSALWIPEALGRDPFSMIGFLAAQTDKLIFATGIANIYARDATLARAIRETCAGMLPGRFILGLGVSHPHLVDRIRGHEWNRSAAEADEARLSGDYANDNIRCIHCDADGDS